MNPQTYLNTSVAERHLTDLAWRVYRPGGRGRAPGPGHSAKDRSLSVKTSAPHGFVVHSFADRWCQ